MTFLWLVNRWEDKHKNNQFLDYFVANYGLKYFILI